MKAVYYIMFAFLVMISLMSCDTHHDTRIYYSGKIDTNWIPKFITLEPNDNTNFNSADIGGDTIVLLAISWQRGIKKLIIPEGVTTLKVIEGYWNQREMSVKFPKSLKRIIYYSMDFSDTTEFYQYLDNSKSSNHYNYNSYSSQQKVETDTLVSTSIFSSNGNKYRKETWSIYDGPKIYDCRNHDTITLLDYKVAENWTAQMVYDSIVESGYRANGYNEIVTYLYAHKVFLKKGIKEAIIKAPPVDYYDHDIIIYSDSSDVETLILDGNCRLEGSFPNLKRIDGGNYTYEQYRKLIKLGE